LDWKFGFNAFSDAKCATEPFRHSVSMGWPQNVTYPHRTCIADADFFESWYEIRCGVNGDTNTYLDYLCNENCAHCAGMNATIIAKDCGPLINMGKQVGYSITWGNCGNSTKK
jgi:hypothetical protein